VLVVMSVGDARCVAVALLAASVVGVVVVLADAGADALLPTTAIDTRFVELESVGCVGDNDMPLSTDGARCCFIADGGDCTGDRAAVGAAGALSTLSSSSSSCSSSS
jgi:hypothetical protein